MVSDLEFQASLGLGSPLPSEPGTLGMGEWQSDLVSCTGNTENHRGKHTQEQEENRGKNSVLIIFRHENETDQEPSEV